jgi:murein DD-endopeptidase MepM/ murein hydrolase activator NlpD
LIVAHSERDFPRVEAEPMKPWIWPCEGRISSRYGWRTHPVTGKTQNHNGLDIAAPRGTPVRCVEDGTVADVNRDPANLSGLYVVVEGSEGRRASFCHLDSIAVAEGEGVEQGGIVGYVGSTGRSTGPHLHLTARVHGKTVDPCSLMPARPAKEIA